MVLEQFPTIGPYLVKISLLFLILLVVGFGGTAFFGSFIGGVLWPFLTNLFGTTKSGISLDNIEAIIIVLVSAVVFFVLIFGLFVWLAIRTFGRRIIPQSIIDELADHRDKGIKILNDIPNNQGKMTDQEKEQFVQDWKARWEQWRREVIATLDKSFTKAERLSFQRLGLIAEYSFHFAVTPDHNHFLMQLAKQLTILENLIALHQERH